MNNTLMGKKCGSCGFQMLNPSFSCPSCGSSDLIESSFGGRGHIYTYTVVMVGFGHLASRAPYVLAIVELDEGLKILTIIEDVDKDKVSIGNIVRFKKMEEGTGPIFSPEIT
jgi:uncharacterized OB-fold protein